MIAWNLPRRDPSVTVIDGDERYFLASHGSFGLAYRCEEMRAERIRCDAYARR